MEIVEDTDDVFSIADNDRNYMLSFIKLQKDQESQNLIRNGDKLRTNLLSKLAYKKLWVSPALKPKTHQSCIIFDWDDTILCTSFLTPYPSLLADPYRKIPIQMQEVLDQLDNQAVLLLRLAKTLGMVFIITNAAEGWVEMSSKRFLP